MANVQVETAAAVVAKPDNGVDAADFAAHVVGGRLRRGQTVENGKPDQGLRLLTQPGQELVHVNPVARLLAPNFHTAPHCKQKITGINS